MEEEVAIIAKFVQPRQDTRFVKVGGKMTEPVEPAEVEMEMEAVAVVETEVRRLLTPVETEE